MQLLISVIAGGGAGQRYALVLPPGHRATIGRATDNTIAFPDERSVSSHHCEVLNDADRLVLVDRGSTNGIYSGEQRVQTLVLAPGQVVRLGKRGPVLQFQLQPGSSGAVQPPPQQQPPGAPHLCAVCGAPLGPDAFRCAECGRAQCASHYDPMAGCCVSCASAQQVAGGPEDDPFGGGGIYGAPTGAIQKAQQAQQAPEPPQPESFVCFRCFRRFSRSEESRQPGLCRHCAVRE